MTEILYREMPLVVLARRDADPAKPDAKPDANVLRFRASSEAPVMRYGDAEILKHDAASVRLDRLRTLGSALVNHDPNQRAAKILSADIVDGQLEVEVRFGSTVFAQQVRQEVDDGLLRGVSVGYRVYEWLVDEEARSYTATDWEPFEVTFTPIPADATVGTGRSAEAWGQLVRSITPTAARAAPLEARVSDPVIPKPAAVEPAAPNHNHDESVRALAMAETREITVLAEEHGLRASDYLGLSKADAQSKMLRALAEKRATPAPAAPVVEMRVDAADKARDAATGAILHGAGFRAGHTAKANEGNPLVGLRLSEIVQRAAVMLGFTGAWQWTRQDLAWFALGKPEQMSSAAQMAVRAANVTIGSFPTFVFLNALNKALALGYERGAAASTYRQLVSQNPVSDFKQFAIGALGVGNLVKTAENAAFPELDKADGVYNSTVKMWGGTMALTLQALISDDTAQFMRHLGMAGAICDKTMDRRAYQKLLMGTSSDEATSTWTSNTTSGCSPVFTTADTLAAARGKVSTGIVSLINKVGLDGNPLGTMPRFLLAGPTAGQYLASLKASVPGQQVGNGFAGIPDLVVSPWLEASALTGYSTTTFYVLGDPTTTTGLVLSEVIGFENVQVQQYDAGAVAALNWKLWKPFEMDLHYLSVGGTSTVAAAQQCTT